MILDHQASNEHFRPQNFPQNLGQFGGQQQNEEKNNMCEQT